MSRPPEGSSVKRPCIFRKAIEGILIGGTLEEELERLSKHDATLRMMLRRNLPLDRDTYMRLSGLDPTEEVGAEQEANFPEPFQRVKGSTQRPASVVAGAHREGPDGDFGRRTLLRLPIDRRL